MGRFDISTLQQAEFKERGSVTFSPFPTPTETLLKEVEEEYAKRLDTIAPFQAGRDLWKKTPRIRSWLIQQVAPLVLELCSKPKIRLIADQRIPSKSPLPSQLHNWFAFTFLLAIVCVDKESITILHPSMPPSPSAIYLAVFGLPQGRYIDKSQDAARHALKQEGYAYGDLLRHESHPLIFRSY
jgi:hypothetical protein